MESSIRGLLNNHARLRIRRLQYKINFDIFTHYQHDSGCYREAVSFLRPYFNMYDRAVVMFDKKGSGQEARPRDLIETEVEHLLSINGWEDRARVIVIDPELEQWIWGDYTTVSGVLEWPNGSRGLMIWLNERNYLRREGNLKASPPKEAFKNALQHVSKRRTSNLYLEIAQEVNIEHCTDPAFAKLKSILQNWFPIKK